MVLLKVDFAEYTSKSTIHGLSEACAAQSKKAKLLWAALLVGIVVFLSYQISTIIIEYLEEPVSTRVKIVRAPEVPGIIYCPKSWIDERKALGLGIDKDALSHIIGFLISTPLEVPTSGLNSTSVKWGKSLLAERGGMLNQMLLDLALAPEEVIQTTLSLRAAVRVTPVAHCQGICYLITAKTLVREPFAEAVQFKIDLRNNPIAFGLKKNPTQIGIKALMWGERGRTCLEEEGIQVSFDQDHIFKAKISKVYRVRRKRAKFQNATCRDYGDLGREECAINCVNRMTNHYLNCSFHHRLEEYDPTRRYCNVHEEDENPGQNAGVAIKLNDELLKCATSSCPMPCLQTHFDIMAQSRLKDNDNLTMVQFEFINLHEIYLTEEYKTYTVSVLLANVGGTVSLMCGASFLSLVQLMCICCYRKKNYQEEMARLNRKASMELL